MTEIKEGPAVGNHLRLSHVPRLSIVHLLWLTACTAGVVGFLSWLVGIETGDLNIGLILAVIGCLYGFFLFGSGLIAWHSVRRLLWPLEPGERLILCMTAVVVAEMTLFQTSQRRLIYPAVVAVLTGALAIFTCMMEVIRTTRQPWWRALFVVIALQGSVPLAIAVQETIGWFLPMGFWSGSSVVLAMLALALIAAAVLRDLSRNPPRHWLHWMGVGTTVLTRLIWGGFLFYILFWFAV